jgi:hypothetical protein
MNNEEMESEENAQYRILIWKECERIVEEKGYKLSIIWDYELTKDGVTYKFRQLNKLHCYLLMQREADKQKEFDND